MKYDILDSKNQLIGILSDDNNVFAATIEEKGWSCLLDFPIQWYMGASPRDWATDGVIWTGGGERITRDDLSYEERPDDFCDTEVQ